VETAARSTSPSRPCDAPSLLGRWNACCPQLHASDGTVYATRSVGSLLNGFDALGSARRLVHNNKSWPKTACRIPMAPSSNMASRLAGSVTLDLELIICPYYRYGVRLSRRDQPLIFPPRSVSARSQILLRFYNPFLSQLFRRPRRSLCAVPMAEIGEPSGVAPDRPHGLFSLAYRHGRRRPRTYRFHGRGKHTETLTVRVGGAGLSFSQPAPFLERPTVVTTPYTRLTSSRVADAVGHLGGQASERWSPASRIIGVKPLLESRDPSGEIKTLPVRCRPISSFSDVPTRSVAEVNSVIPSQRAGRGLRPSSRPTTMLLPFSLSTLTTARSYRAPLWR